MALLLVTTDLIIIINETVFVNSNLILFATKLIIKTCYFLIVCFPLTKLIVDT